MNPQYRQVFYVYDELTLRSTGTKGRVDVHRDGDWHFSINAFIVRKNANNIVEVLVQERSEYVDIAQDHFDQSLATQLLVADDESVENAVYRGLKDELSIEKKDVKVLQNWNEIGQIKMSKKYKYNPELWNREFAVNYFVVLKDDVKLKRNYRVKKTDWLPWEEFTGLVRVQPNRFTKSTRLYCADVDISRQIGEIMSGLCNYSSKQINNVYFEGKILMASFGGFDVMAIQHKRKAVWKLMIYKTEYSITSHSEYDIADIREVENAMFRVRDKECTIELFENEVFVSIK